MSDRINQIRMLIEDEITETVEQIIREFSKVSTPEMTELLENTIDKIRSPMRPLTPPQPPTPPGVASPPTPVTLPGVATPPVPEETKKGCIAKMKSGLRKNAPCGKPIVDRDLCKHHLENESIPKCKTLLKSGKTPGKECGRSVIHDGDHFEEYCSLHKPTSCRWLLESGEVCGRKFAFVSEKVCRIHLKDEKQIDTKKIILKMNRYGNKIHEPSELVFDQETKRVIGKQLRDGNLSRILNDEDFECVRIYGLPIAEKHQEEYKAYLMKKNLWKE